MLDFSEMCAANEDDYRYQRHRTSPIGSTIYSIPNYPKKLRIYLTNSSPYWQVCCFFKGKTYRRSLKTTIRQVAIRAAKDFFHQSVADLYGTTINIREDKVLLFSDLVAPTIAIETARTQRGDYSIAGLNILRSASVGKNQSKRVLHNPNSVANIQRQLDPLAFDPTVKKLTN